MKKTFMLAAVVAVANAFAGEVTTTVQYQTVREPGIIEGTVIAGYELTKGLVCMSKDLLVGRTYTVPVAATTQTAGVKTRVVNQTVVQPAVAPVAVAPAVVTYPVVYQTPAVVVPYGYYGYYHTGYCGRPYYYHYHGHGPYLGGGHWGGLLPPPHHW